LQKEQRKVAEKILIVGTAHPFRGGGISTFNQVMATELQKMGYEVRILTFTLQYPSFLFPGKTQYSEDPAPKHLQIDVKLNSINPFNWFKVGREYKKWGADLVIFRFWTPFMGPAFGTLARIIKGNKKSRIIAITDNVVPHEKSIIDRPFTNYFLSACDAYLCMSKAVLKDLEVFDKNKPKVYHPHPLYDNFGETTAQELALKHLKLDPEYRYILFFGFIRKYKGLDLLLEAMGAELLQDFNIKLLVAGEFYEPEEPYRALIQKFKLEEKVVLHTHFIPDDEVKYYFSAADIVAQTYHHATQSGVTQIAYHFEKPMLVTEVGGLAETVPNRVAGYVVKPTPVEIAGALFDFFNNNRFQELTLGVKASKKRFGWDAFLKSLLSLR
jgi:glycosyltransferase involved in cell wall biosynthesis